MNKHKIIRQSLTLILTLCLVLPGAAFGVGKSGKKNFNEGMKYEKQMQWDLAAQEFALALAAEPGNPEYKLHLLKALQQASLMFMKRGEALEQQNDYASAYTAYKQAFNYDQTNELARVKMERMIDQQKAQSGGNEPASYTPSGNFRPTSSDVRVADRPRTRDVVQSIEYKETSLKFVIANIAKSLGINVLFDDTFKDNTKFSYSEQNVTLARALDHILMMTKNVFEQIDRRTILVYQDNPTNRQRFERLMVKTFYVNNAEVNDVRTMIQTMVGGQRAMATLKGTSSLVVRATPQELKLIQELIDTIDKNVSEVVIEVNIYEVSQNASLALGNQVAIDGTTQRDIFGKDKDGNPIYITRGTTAGLSNLGGVGRDITSAAGLGLLYKTALGFSGPGVLLGLPPTSLSLLQSKGNSKLLASTQIHALDGQANKTRIGRKVPVQLGTALPSTYLPTATPQLDRGGVGGAINGAVGGALGLGALGGYGGAFSSIQYNDVGLNIDVTPKITNEGYVEIKMNLESSSVEASSSGDTVNLTPSFTQRTLNTVSRIQDGKTAIVAGVKQESKGDSRQGIPVLSMLPVLGRFITAPKQSSTMSDIIITVTPHIVRSAEIKAEDHLAHYSGGQTTPLTLTVEEVVSRAQEDDDRDRRMIAQQQGIPDTRTQLSTPALVAETTAPNTTPTPKVVNAGISTQAPFNQAPSGMQTITSPAVPGTSSLTNASLERANPGTQPPANNPAIPVDTKSVANVAGAPNTSKVKKTAQEREPEEPAPDLSEFITPPPEGVQPARLMTVQPPENIERIMKEAAKPAATPRASSAGNPGGATESKPAPAPEYVPPTFENPKTPVQVAAPRPVLKPKSDHPETSSKATPNAASTAKTVTPEAPKGKSDTTVGLSLMPTLIKQQVGKSFIVVVSVNGQASMTGANISLNYDPAMLQVKSVRAGEVLGSRPDLTHQVSGNGNLLITLQQSQEKAAPASANGKLVVVEFTAMGPGQTSINFNGSETQVILAGNLSAQISASAAQVQISREAVSLANEK